MLPPIHVLYFRSGGANILIRMSFTASRCTSWSNRSPNPLHSVEPPDRTMFPNSDFRRSMSVRLMASTTIWCIPGYSRPISSGSNRISGAFHRSEPIYYAISIPLHEPRCVACPTLTFLPSGKAYSTSLPSGLPLCCIHSLSSFLGSGAT